jgi:hypothetical protein
MIDETLLAEVRSDPNCYPLQVGIYTALLSAVATELLIARKHRRSCIRIKEIQRIVDAFKAYEEAHNAAFAAWITSYEEANRDLDALRGL